MNEFLNKDPNRSRQHPSIDGISTRPRVRFDRPGGSIEFARKPSAETSSDSSLDNFARQDGFHASRQQEIGHSKAATEPLIIERSRRSDTRHHKGFLSKFKSRKNAKRGHKRPLTRKKKILRGVGIFLVIISLIVGFLVAKGYINLRKVLSGGGGAAALQENVDPSRLKGEGDGRVNILLLGRGGEGHEGADLTDTIILVSIDPVAKEAALVSIPRDLYVKVPGNGSMKINQVFYTGKMAVLDKYSRPNDAIKKQAESAGFTMIEQTVEKTLGVPIHYNAMVDFTGFKQAVNTVGGIDFNVPSPLREQMRIDGRTYILNVKPGQQHFDGFKALAYSRSRHTSARGDFDRSERQRLIVVALKNKIFSLGTFSNPNKISQLLDTFGGHVQTNFSVQDLNRLHEISKEISSDKISSIGLADPPNNYLTTANIGGLSVVIPTAGAGNFKPIQSFLRNTLKDSYLKSENASILVLNGTDKAGLAAAKGEELKSYGYNVIGVDNAPTKSYSNTIIVDMRNGSKKYTKNYLEKRFGVSVVGSLPDSTIQTKNADFVIIIGSDTASRE